MKLKTLLCALCLLVCTVINAQNSNTTWNPQQEKILNKFQLTKQDSRGITLHSEFNSVNCSNQISIKAALMSFFTTVKARDLTHYCISEDFKDEFSSFMDRPLGLYEITNLYVQLSTSKK